MFLTVDRRSEGYSPLYFLAALGSGGLVVTFFMWLMFWVPHPGRPVPVFSDIAAAFVSGGAGLKLAIPLAMIGIAVFAYLLARLFLWNLRAYAEFKRGSGYEALRNTNAETQLLAGPLTAAMAVNVAFIIGLVFVPGLWQVVEYLFPLALLAFLGIGWWAMRLMGDFWGRVLTRGGFECSKNNSFAQLIPAFALAMIGVGLAAPAAMSQTAWVAGASYVLSSFFLMGAVVIGGIKLVMGLRAMMENGASDESAPSLWIVVPILTVLGIAFMRQDHGLHVHMGGHGTAADTFAMLTRFLVLQVGFALFGWVVLRRQGYFARFVVGPESSPGSYALVCPGVALSVMGQFFINKGLVAVGLLTKFSLAYWMLTLVPIALQIATIWLVFTLNAKHFGGTAESKSLAPAE